MGAQDNWPVAPLRLRCRIERQRQLLAALRHGALSAAQASALLGCSATAARNDLRALAAAGVVAAGSEQFGLTGDARSLAVFLQGLGADPALPGGPGQGRYIHAMFSDAADIAALDTLTARRDPLVAALFGAGR